ncbi:hypothetical protein [Aureivirga marina]|uniref:hypothetical protein n=1 Tax=Aureivirga marina TaxID=1182451 RepID=UPI0018C9E619|nr:hypothetical protein [Aureivirga marina]
MKPLYSISFILTLFLFLSCHKESKIEKKGFSVSSSTMNTENQTTENNEKEPDTNKFETRPKKVLLTYHQKHRLTPIFKVNYQKIEKKIYSSGEPKIRRWVGNIGHHLTYDYNENDGNQWNQNFMPGMAAAYGYNFVNISHFNFETKKQHKLFKNPVLIKTFYYPAYSQDTLNSQPIHRNFYMVSVYDEDTNKDGKLNTKDLRRIYSFDLEGKNKKALVPKDYSILSSQYDSGLDYMYIYTIKDENKNGKKDTSEAREIFWVDMKNPENNGKLYE